VAYGSYASFTGTLTASAGGAGLPGRVVRLMKMSGPFYSRAWVPSLIATTTASGTFTFSSKPAIITDYRAEFMPSATDAYAPSIGATVQVGPQAKVYVKAPKKAKSKHPPSVYAMIGDGGGEDTDQPYLETWKWQKVGGVYKYVLRHKTSMARIGAGGRHPWESYRGYTIWVYTPYYPYKLKSFTAGKYRVRIHHGGLGLDSLGMYGYFREKYSAWAYITVK
jgi:hypothetical protein